MKKLLNFSIFVLVAVLLVACDGKQVVGDGKQVSKTRSVGVFNQIETNGGYELDVQVGKTQLVKVTTDQNIQPYVVTDVQDGILNIHTKSGFKISHKTPIRVAVQVKDLQGITISGAADIKVANISSNVFTLKSSGATQAQLVGKASNVVIRLSGSGKVNAKDLQSDNVTVRIAGAGEIKVHANKRLSAKIAGSGEVQYWGNPVKVDQSVAGAGSVKRAS